MAGVHPLFGTFNLREGAYLLQGLYQVNLDQLARGYPGVLGALAPGAAGPGRRRLRYIRTDPREHWQSIREIWRFGGGDCEDLATAVAAELTYNGTPARPVVYRVRPGLAHVVVQRLTDGAIFDPSKLGGMGETPQGGLAYREDLARMQRRIMAGDVATIANVRALAYQRPLPGNLEPAVTVGGCGCGGACGGC